VHSLWHELKRRAVYGGSGLIYTCYAKFLQLMRVPFLTLVPGHLGKYWQIKVPMMGLKAHGSYQHKPWDGLSPCGSTSERSMQFDVMVCTGEVTLTGRVLPIGGVKEKTLAARRSDVKNLIFPEANRRDFDELAGADLHDLS
jgi:hypothetical protein